MKSNRFVFDSNTLISAFIFEQSTPTSSFDKARSIGRLIANLETYNEIYEVFLRPKFDRYISLDKREDILSNLNKFLIFIETTE